MRVLQFIDICPTVTDLTGPRLQTALEGTSLRPLLEDTEVKWDNPTSTGHGMLSGTGFLTKEGRREAIHHGHRSLIEPHDRLDCT